MSGVKIKEQIFKGSGKIFIGMDEKTNEKLIVKVLDTRNKDSSIQKNIEAETKIGLSLSQDSLFLVKIREIIHRPDFVIMIMEYCKDGDLSNIIAERITTNKPFSDEEIIEMAFQLGKAVEVLHINDVVHRDLKTDNIFVVRIDEKNCVLKLGDFGIARKISSANRNTTIVMGTIGYTPPEVLNGDQEYNKAGDVYSLGIIFIELVDLLHPFMNERKIVQQGRIFSGQANKPRGGMSPLQLAFREFALRMMDVNPINRPTIREVLAYPAFMEFLTRQYIVTKKQSMVLASTTSAQNTPSSSSSASSLSSSSSASPSSSSSPTISPSSSSSSTTSPSSSTLKLNNVELLPATFLVHPKKDFVCDVTSTGCTKVTFTPYFVDYATVFLNQSFNAGIFRWEVKILYSSEEPKSTSCIGFCVKTNLERFYQSKMYGIGFQYGALQFGRNTPSSLLGVTDRENRSKGLVIPDNSLIAIEANMNTHIVSFFVGGNKIRQCFSHVPDTPPLHFGMSGANGFSFTSLSFLRLSVSTAAAIVCDFFKCGE